MATSSGIRINQPQRQSEMQRQSSDESASTMQNVSHAMAASELLNHMKQFAKENPSGAALWCFCIGFVVAWKLKPW